MKYRKSLLALTCALPLVLTACGKDEGGNDNGAATNAAENSSAADPSESTPGGDKAAESSDSSSSAKADDKADKDKGQQGQESDAESTKGDRDGADKPAEGNRPPAPAGDRNEGGREQKQGNRASGGANGGDTQAITTLVQGMGKQRSAYDFLNYSLNNSCKAYIDSQGGEKTIRSNNDTIKAMGPEGNKAIPVPKISSVKEVNVNGDRATARVTASYGTKAPQTESMSFARENGKWTLCPN